MTEPRQPSDRRAATGEPGVGVDARGHPAADPTPNVLDLVAAAIQRQDDLREADREHIREIMDLRGNFGRELREAESARLDSIRAVDVAAVQRAAEVQAAAQDRLAVQVVQTAETMRTTVAATASAAATELRTALQPLHTTIDDLRRSQSEATGGKAQVVETQARGGSTGLWIGLAVGGLGLFLTFISTIAFVLSQ